MPRKGITALIFFALLLLGGCGAAPEQSGGDGCPNFYCPSISDNVTWDKYGKLQIGNFGSDTCARKLISNCGWHVYQMHNGGYGDTLEVTTPGEEVVLVWAWNDLSDVYLFPGWQGSTAEGITMGSTLEEVQAAYPGLVHAYGDTYVIEDASRKRKEVNVYFKFMDNKLVEIDVY